jgi:hypothetical protein
VNCFNCDIVEEIKKIMFTYDSVENKRLEGMHIDFLTLLILFDYWVMSHQFCNCVGYTYIVLNERMVVNDEFEKKWKKATLACRNVVSQHFSRRTKRNQKTLGLLLGRCLDLGPPEFEMRILTI